VQNRYPDGSFSSHIYPGTTARRNKTEGIAVRVIEYHLDATAVTAADHAAEPDPESRTYRLLTTITDPTLAPAEQLAALYFQRWDIQTAFGELRTHQRGAGVVLRSKLADGVIQEVYGYLSVHYAIRWLMHSVGNRFSGRTRTGCRSPHPSGPHGEPPPTTRVFPPDTLADGSHTVTAKSSPNCSPPAPTEPTPESSNAKRTSTRPNTPTTAEQHRSTGNSRSAPS